MLVKMFVVENDRGCKLSNGLKVENGWHELSTDCQEECFCMKNEFNCRPKPCDLIENVCLTDGFGEHFCYPIKNLNCTEPETITTPGTTITAESTISPDTTTAPSTTIAPSFAIDRVIDIAANQQVGTIDSYYDNYEFSMEAKLNNLKMDGIYTNSSVLGFLITKIEILVPFIINLHNFYNVIYIGPIYQNITVGQRAASRGRGEAFMWLFHGYNSNFNSYAIWYKMHGSTSDGRSLKRYDIHHNEWHKGYVK